jgi:hypothetical protein
MRNGTLHAFAHGLIIEFKGIDQLQMSGNIREAGLANFLTEAPNIEETASIRPTPVGITLKIGVLDVECSNSSSKSL